MKILLTLALLLAACRPPAPSAPRPERVVRVAIEDGTDGTGWFRSHRTALSTLWVRMDASGYQWVIDQRAPDVIVRTFDARGCERSAGEYLLGSRVVSVDPACVHSDEELRFAVMHECLHWLTWRDYRWAGHLCKHAHDVHDCHPSVHGTGVLSPVLGEVIDEYGVEISTANANISDDDVRLIDALRATR